MLFPFRCHFPRRPLDVIDEGVYSVFPLLESPPFPFSASHLVLVRCAMTKGLIGI